MSLDDMLRSTIVEDNSIDVLLGKYITLLTKPEELLGRSAKDDEKLKGALKDTLGEIKQRVELYDTSPDGRKAIYQSILNTDQSPEAKAARAEALGFLKEAEKTAIESAGDDAVKQYAVDALDYRVKKMGLPKASDDQKKIFKYNELSDDLKGAVEEYFINGKSIVELLGKYATINKPNGAGIKEMLGPEATEEDGEAFKEDLENELKGYIEMYAPDMPDKLKEYIIDRVKKGPSLFMQKYLMALETEIMASAYATMTKDDKKKIGYKLGGKKLEIMGYKEEEENLVTQVIPELAEAEA